MKVSPGAKIFKENAALASLIKSVLIGSEPKYRTAPAVRPSAMDRQMQKCMIYLAHLPSCLARWAETKLETATTTPDVAKVDVKE